MQIGQLSGPNVTPRLHGATHLVGGHVFEVAVVIGSAIVTRRAGCWVVAVNKPTKMIDINYCDRGLTRNDI